jgi:hypothetical protein
MPTEHPVKPLTAQYDDRISGQRKNPFVYVGRPELLTGAKRKSSISPNGVSGTGIGQGSGGAAVEHYG